MAAFDTTRPSAALEAGRVSRFVVEGFATLAAWNDARVTRKALNQLTARELDDIGLSTSDIDGVARRVYR